MTNQPVPNDLRAGSTLLVAARDHPTADVVTLTLARLDGGRLPDWTPGSHIDLTTAGGTTRQYSLCGDRWDAHHYRVGVLREPGGRGGSAYVHDELAVGDQVSVGGPRNHFPLVPSERYLFVAGGIGITPLLPMVHQADLLGADWRLLYGGRTRASMAFLDELAPYGDRVHVSARDERGRLDLATHLAGAGADAAVKVYACGPPGLLNALERLAEGWPVGRLRTERFVAREQGAPALSRPFELVLARSGRTLQVVPEVTVLDAVRASGVPVLSSCGQGTCGTCETAVVAGVPDHRDSILDDDERAQGDSMFICVSRACSDRLVLDL